MPEDDLEGTGRRVSRFLQLVLGTIPLGHSVDTGQKMERPLTPVELKRGTGGQRVQGKQYKTITEERLWINRPDGTDRV